jgi:ACT domain-containing protein
MKIDEQEIRDLAREALKQLGDTASAENVEQVVKAAMIRLKQNTPTSSPLPREFRQKQGNRVIITAFGKNQVGILAGLTDALAQCRCDIIDLTQKIIQEFFTIMLLVDITESTMEFDKIKEMIVARGEELNLKVIVQHEEIFNTMHRI